MTDRLSPYISWSVALHGAVAALIFLRAVLMPSEPLMIQQAIRVDVVDLPQKMAEMPTPAPPAPTPVAQATEAPAKPAAKPTAEPVAKPHTVSLNKKSKTQKEALNQIKAMTALDKIRNELAEQKKAAPAVVKGNQISEGTALSGLDKMDYDRYFADVETKIRSNWNIPQWLAESEFRAQIQVLIDERGYVIKKILRKPSGNPVFDAKVAEAIDSSLPLPEPPARLRGVLATSGIIFNFPE